MSEALALIRSRFDRLGMILSGLCVVHCLGSLAIVALFGFGGSLLLDPAIHRVGLGVAVVVGAVAIGLGVMRHRRSEPLLLGILGLALMALALVAGHGPAEALLTIAGVTIVAAAHWRNLRHLGR
jgi:hypothetical protein